MNMTASGLAKRYLKRLRTHVANGTPASLAKADVLGKEAKRQKLATVELAQVYGQSLAHLIQPNTEGDLDPEFLERAGTFFQRSQAPIAKAEALVAHRAQLKSARIDAKAVDAAKRLAARETTRRVKAETALSICRREHSVLATSSNLMQQQCRQLSHQILRVQEEERKLISRELHDEISQILTGINVRLAALAIEAATNSGGLKKKIASTQRLVKKSVDVVHRFARELRPAMLDDLGLVPTMLSLMKDVRKETGLQIHLSTSPVDQIEALAGIQRTVLYRITQEAFTNIRKHAKATEVHVSLELKEHDVCLSICDNGDGFNVQRLMDSRSHKCLGIIGMRERTEMTGGEFSIESNPPDGTAVMVKLPVRSPTV